MLKTSAPGGPAGDRAGAILSVAAALVWPLQAAILAIALGGLLTDPSGVRVFAAPAGFLALAILRSALDTAAQRALSAAADRGIADLRAEIVGAESAAASGSSLGGAGTLAALASDKLEALRPYLLRYRPARLRATVVPILILGLSLWHSWAVAVVLLAAGPLIPLFMALVGWAAKTASERQMAKLGQMSDLLADRLAALSDLRLIGAGPAVVDGFEAASEDLRDRTMAVLRVAFLSSTVLELFSALGVAMVAIWVGFTLLGELGWGAWGAGLSPTSGIYLLLLAPEFFQPLRDLAAAWHDRAGADAVLSELEAWRGEGRDQRLGSGAGAASPDTPLALSLTGLRFRGVSYPDLDLGPGDTVALLGPSGSGKTSLLRMIAGLDRADAGAIGVDGAPLDAATADAWRAGLGWMPQAPHFLNRSLRFNIGFGASLESQIVRDAHLAGVVDRLPKGDLTTLGERGAGLSGGEARRVTLARALARRPRLILADEPTADLDAGTASGIADSLVAFAAAGGALIVATHDEALAARMGRVIRLGEGRA